MKSKTRTISLIISILVIATGLYLYFSTGKEDQQPLTVVASNNQAQAKFQILVSQLQSISFDTDIFSDPHFNALVDFTVPVAAETIGRLDPFAPVPGISTK